MFTRWRTTSGPGTHYLMDGGILDVPYADTDAFFVEYLSALHRKQKVFVVEQKTLVFRFFVDLDWRDTSPITDACLNDILRAMSSVVPGRMLVARAHVRTEADGRIKSGVHIHWPDTKVRRAEALAFRTRILLELGDDPEWNTRIDSSVYGGSGLRMIGSHKVPAGDPYMPQNGAITIETLRDYSIRSPDDTESLSQVTEVTNHGPLERYIQRYIPGQEKTRIRRVIRRSPRILWVQTDSQYCAHVEKEHKSNHVWFYVFDDTITQRCHDEDTCKDYVGREYILSPSIVDELTSNVTVDRSTCVSICDLVPAHWFPENPLNQVRTPASPIFGAGPNRVGPVQRKHSSVRSGRGRGGRRTTTQGGRGKHI